MTMEIRYGKADVAVYRTYGTPLTGVTPIPESTFTGRPNTLLAAEIELTVMGEVFQAAYTEGDNRNVVATDTMKNVIHALSLEFQGSTLEGWVDFLGRRFLERYPHMERLRVTGREIPFQPAVVPDGDGGFGPSEVLFGHDRNDRATAWVELEGSADGSATLLDHGCGREGLRLMKISGSAFADFARDELTTLPERPDRPLYTWVDIGWRYDDPAIATAPDVARYVAAEQVADLAVATFHDFVSLSIQHLVHEMGRRILDRWPQLREVSFDAQNRLWDTVAVSDADDRIRSYCDPRPPYGRIGLVLRRD